jgi:hypothetical protein
MPRGHKGEPRTPGSGRKVGTPNRTTIFAKKAFEAAFDGIGGVPALILWAKTNRTEFFKLYGKLIPTDMKITRVINAIDDLTEEELAALAGEE